ncbi:hypothetical protein ACVJGD_005127 [Bradyrhizobium sp. USDA 10063]
MRENRPYGSEGGEANCLPYPYRRGYGVSQGAGSMIRSFAFAAYAAFSRPSLVSASCTFGRAATRAL